MQQALIASQPICLVRYRVSHIKREIMKAAVTLYLLAVLYMTDAYNQLDHLKFQLQKSKLSTESAINRLDRLNRNTQFDTEMKAVRKRNEQMRNFNNYLNPTIEAIRAEVEAAKAEGKDAQSCYDEAFATLKDINSSTWSSGDQCVETAKSSVKSKLTFIEKLLTIGRQLITEVDSIFPNCFGSNIYQMQSCVANQLGTINVAMRSFEKEANSAILNVRSASNDVILQVSRCTSDTVSEARANITDTKLAATKCLKAL